MKRVLAMLIVLALVLSCAPVIPLQANAATAGYYTYTVSGGKATITDCDASISGDIVIPSTLGGYPVTVIDEWAFSDCNSLTGVTIGDSVVSIGVRAFYFCENLTNVTISDSVSTIGDFAFCGCSNLINVVFGNGISDTGVSAFMACTSLRSISIPNSVVKISNSSFRDCTSLESIVIPESVTIIGDRAFTTCENLKDIYYEGTEEQWKSITIGHSNSILTNATLHTVEPLLEHVSVKTLPDKTQYMQGEDLDTTGLTLTLHYSDGSTKDITEGFHVDSWFDSYMIGNHTIYVEYEGYSTYFDVTVVGPTGLTIKTLPDKTEYFRGEYLDTTGLTLALHYSDGTTKDITEGFLIVSWFDSYIIGNHTIYVEYEGYSTYFDVTVVGPTGLTIKTLPDKTVYFRGEYLDTKGLELTVTYSDGTTKDITDGFYIDWFDSYMTGVHTIYVGYEDCRTSYEITVINGGYCGDNLYWELDEDTGVLTISGNGAMSDWNNPWNEWRYSIRSVVIEEGVTNIGSNAFMDCYELTQISIPSSVTYIGENAFSNCSNLTSIKLSDGVQSIGNYAFSYCSNLSDITIPDTVNYIGDNAFGYCVSLTEIDLPSDLSSLGYGTFYGSGLTHITIPENISYINNQTFAGCESLASVTIPASVTGIGYDAFYNCYGLTTVNYQGYEENKVNMMIDSGNDNLLNANWIYRGGVERTGIVIENLPDKTEYWINEELDTTGLTVAVTYSDGEKFEIWEGYTVSDIDTSTAGTKTVTVTYKDLTTTFNITVKEKSGACGKNMTWALSEDGVLTISGTGAMDNWGNGVMAPWYPWSGSITALVIEDGITGLGAFAFYGCSGLIEAPIPNSVTVLGDYVFSGCRGLSAIEIPKGVTSIGTCAFSACTSLAEITIPDGITNLSYGMFEYCPMLTEITIPDSVTNIGDYAFSNCGRLSTVHFQGNQKQMLQITVGQNNESLMSASWNCNNQDGDPVITGITIKTLPVKTEYMLYENLDTTGLVLTAQFSDGSEVDITNGFAVTGFDSSWVGSQLLTVSYSGFTAEFEITVIKGGRFSDTLFWLLDDSGVLTIFGTGAMYDYEHPWRDWSYEIRSVVIEEGVTYIGSYAFNWYEYLTEITIPASVTGIGYGAFESCYSLYTVHYGGTKNQKAQIAIGEWNEYLTNATWRYPTVAVHQQGDTRKEYESLEEALAAATAGTVSLVMDVTEKTVAIKPGVTLDLNGHTLTADLVVGLNGAVILDGGKECTGGGLLKTGRYTLVYAPSEGQQVVPVWNGVNGYIFTKVTILELTQDTDIEGTASYTFLPRFSNSEAAALLSDGGLNNGLQFKVCMTWADGKSQMFYTYSDDLVAKVYDGTGSLAFSLTITGIADITDAVVTAEIVADCGAVASSEGLSI